MFVTLELATNRARFLMPTTKCPSAADLERLFRGGLPANEADRLEEHLLACDHCMTELRSRMPARDVLSEALNGVGAPFGTPVPRRVASLMGQLIALWPKLSLTAEPAMLTFECPNCRKKLSVQETLAGKKVKCPGCAQVVAAPASAGVLVAAQAPPRGASLVEDRTIDPSSPPGDLRRPTTIADAPTIGGVDRETSLRTPQADGVGGMATDASKFDQSGEAGKAASEMNEYDFTEFLAPPQQPDELGRLGTYRILKILGHGGMGVVYLAEDTKLKRRVAIKAMLPKLAASSSAGQRFLREAQTMASLKHDHIVTIYQVDEDRGVPFLAMEFLLGQPLDQRLATETRLPLKEIVRIGREMAEGLGAAHEVGLIHRDIKPGNIWIEAPRGRVKILDFGLARAADQDSNLTQQGAMVGTPAFMAPEQAKGQKLDARCDLFSLGVVLYRLCTGRQPFVGNDAISTIMAVAMHDPLPPMRIRDEVPPELSDLVMRLLEKDPAKRIASAREVVEALQKLENRTTGRETTQVMSIESLADKDGPTATSKSPPTAREKPVTKAAPRRRLPTILAAAVLALGLIGAGLWAAGVIRFGTPDGDLVFETDDPEFAFARSMGDGLTLEDRKAKRVYHIRAVRQGNDFYELEVTDKDADLVFKSKTFAVQRGGKVALKAWFERKDQAPPPVAANDLLETAKWVIGKKGSVHLIKDNRPDWFNQVNDKLPLPPFALTAVNLEHIAGRQQADFLSDDDLKRLSNLPDLEALDLSGQPITVKSLEHLKGCRKIGRIEIGNTRIDFKAAVPILAHFPDLGEFTFYGHGADELASLVAKNLKVRTIRNWGSDITAKGIAALAESAALENLDLEHRHNKPGDLHALAKAKNLRHLSVTGESSLLDDLRTIQEALPNCKIFLNRKPLPATADVDAAWVSDVAKMPAEKQANAVLAKLRERNPGSDGIFDSGIKDNAVNWCNVQGFQDIAPIRALANLREFAYRNAEFGDLAPLRGLPLMSLEVFRMNVSDLTPLKEMKLTKLALQNTSVSDLSPLKGMPLQELNCISTRVKDLSPLKGMKLVRFWACDLDVEDLSPLRDMPLKILCIANPNKHLEVLRAIKTLEKINDKPAAEFWKELDASTAIPEAWIQGVAKMTPDKQLEAVAAKLKECNPGFDGKIPDAKVEQNVVVELALAGQAIADIAALRALAGLRHLNLDNTRVGDLKPLKGLPLESLNAYHSEISDLSPLIGAPLTKLALDHPRVADLSPLRDMKLTQLDMAFTHISDLTPLKGMRLTRLNVNQTKVNDLSPLKGMPLETLFLAEAPVQDLSPLAGMKLKQLNLYRTAVTDLSLLRGMPLTYLEIHETKVSDLSPLKEMPLVELFCDYRRAHAETLRSIKTLQKINGKPAAEFWKEADAAAAPIPEMWFQDVAKLTAEKQAEAVAAKLKERNPGFDGKLSDVSIRNGAVEALHIEVDSVSDVSPVGALRALGVLDMLGRSGDQCRFADLSSIARMKQLKSLTFAFTQASDLTPLKSFQLNYLNCGGTRVSDLSPLQGMPLENLNIASTPVTDLSPLKELPLHTIWLHQTKIADLTPLAKLRLQNVNCSNTPVADLSVLKGMPLEKLFCAQTKVADLSFLKGAPLKSLVCDAETATKNAPTLRSIPSLETINQTPVADFWKSVERK